MFLPSSTESRRGHATMKTNQISNAHASYGKTTSGRPSSSLPSWILRSLIWSGHGGHSAPGRPVPPRLACTLWPKAHLSSLPCLCPDRASPTHVDPNPVLPTFGCGSYTTRDLVHPRAGQSRGKRVHPHQDPRSLAFSPRATPNGSFR